VEVTNTVAGHHFQLNVNGFYDIGRRQRAANGFRIAEKSQAMQALLTQFTGERETVFGEAIAQLLRWNASPTTMSAIAHAMGWVEQIMARSIGFSLQSRETDNPPLRNVEQWSSAGL